MGSFEQAYQVVLADEGGYANHPADKGGETFRGIARKWHGDWQGWKIIDEAKTKVEPIPAAGTPRFNWIKRFNNILLTNCELGNLVRDFYKKEMWCKEYEQLDNQAIVNWLFSHTVNISPVAGPGHNKSIVHKWLQMAIGVNADGVLGPKTVVATNQYQDKLELIVSLKDQAKAYYTGIVRRDPSQAVFLKGWLLRV